MSDQSPPPRMLYILSFLAMIVVIVQVILTTQGA
jgi:hypothetical protein